MLDELQQRAKPLDEVGRDIRRLFVSGEFPPEVSDQMRRAYRRLSGRYGEDSVGVTAHTAALLPRISRKGL